jgi:hypothetical protein
LAKLAYLGAVSMVLRRAAARRLAEADCLAIEIAAITGPATFAGNFALHKGRGAENIGEVRHQPVGHNSSVHRIQNPTTQLGSSEKSNEINVDLFSWRP